MKLVLTLSKTLLLLTIVSGCGLNIENPENSVAEYSEEDSSIKECSERVDGVCAESSAFIFITSKPVRADLGTESFDGFCSAAAASAGLKLKYRAVVSDSEQSAAEKFLKFYHDGIWTKDGPDSLVRVATNSIFDSLKDQQLEHLIKDLNGNKIDADLFTGTNHDGSRSDKNCSNWKSRSSNFEVTVGNSLATKKDELLDRSNNPGTGGNTGGQLRRSCALNAHLLCMSSPANLSQ